MSDSVLAAAQSLAARSVEVAQRLRAADLTVAMDRLCELTDALAPFLSHLAVCRDSLQGVSPQLYTACHQYEERLLGIVERIQRGLDTRDWVSLTLCLEHALARALRDYEHLAGPLNRMVDAAAHAA